MGACASCLGWNRHPSHKQDETERLLNSRAPSQYGAIGDDDAGTSQEHDDEADARLEREALEEITARASDNMIDVLHAEYGDADARLPPSNVPAFQQTSEENEDNGEDAEQAWLQDLPVSDLDQEVAVKGSYAGNLVIDMSQLRDGRQGITRREL